MSGYTPVEAAAEMVKSLQKSTHLIFARTPGLGSDYSRAERKQFDIYKIGHDPADWTPLSIDGTTFSGDPT